MAADPLQNVSPGQPLQLDHRSVNAWNDAARARRATKQNGGVGRLPPQRLVPALETYIRNDTGGAIGPRSILHAYESVVSPVDFPFEAASHPVLAGDTPDDATNIFVVVPDGIPGPDADGNGQIGRGVLMGLTVCDVSINDAAHEYAKPIADDTDKLESATRGPARIIWKQPSGSTTRRCFVLLLGTGKDATWVNLPTKLCLSEVGTVPGAGQTLTTEYTPHALLVEEVGERYCETSETDCCPCDDAPENFDVTLNSECPDIDGVFVTVSREEGTNIWSGSTTSDDDLEVTLTIWYDDDNRKWWATFTYDGVKVGTFECLVQVCNPFTITFNWTACIYCTTGWISDTGSGDGGYGGGGGGGGISTPCCPVGTVYPTLCLTSEVISGTCADMDGIQTELTYGGGESETWDSEDEFPYCVSPYIAGCLAQPVSFRVLCMGDVWALYMFRDGFEPVLLATTDDDGLCNGVAITFDVDFDSTGAILPPGVDDDCCVATVRFTATPGECPAEPPPECEEGFVHTSQCPCGGEYTHGVAKTLYATQPGDAFTLTWVSGLYWSCIRNEGTEFEYESKLIGVDSGGGSVAWTYWEGIFSWAMTFGGCEPFELTRSSIWLVITE